MPYDRLDLKDNHLLDRYCAYSKTSIKSNEV